MIHGGASKGLKRQIFSPFPQSQFWINQANSAIAIFVVRSALKSFFWWNQAKTNFLQSQSMMPLEVFLKSFKNPQ